MKLLLFAAAAAFAVPAAAQSTTGGSTVPGSQPGTSSTTGVAQPQTDDQDQMDQSQMDQGQMDQDQMNQGQMNDGQMNDGQMDQTQPATGQTMPPATGQMNTGATGTMADPAGGYQPSAPAMSGTPGPGVQVQFQASQDPNVAFPPPAPLADYPVCKAGQTDDCMERGSRK